MNISWNPWHGCHKISSGCLNCYVYRLDEKYNLLPMKIKKNASFDLPIRKYKNGQYKYPSKTYFWTCFTSDLLLKDCDQWRIEIWEMIKERKDCQFFFITKRIDRLLVNLPSDWGDGYPNVSIGCTVENQEQADLRLPYFLEYPIKHRFIVCAPLLEAINLRKYLSEKIEQVTVDGESGMKARVCDFQWIIDIRKQCIEKNVSFVFRQTGARLLKDGKIYKIPKKFQHSQAQKANLDFRKK